MSSALPLRSSAQVSAKSRMLQAVQTSMLDFYVELSRMPHIQPDSLREPPANGWDSLDVDALRSRGKTEDAIDFVRYLPCLGHKSDITPNITSIDFSRGETCGAWQEELIETPEYVIWIGEAMSRDGHYMLLDTVNGTITEVGLIGGNIRIPYAEFEALPLSDRWMAYETLPAQAWLARERRRLQCLIYLPVPPKGSGEVDYYFRASDNLHESSILAGEEDEDGDYVDSDAGDGDDEGDDIDSSMSADSQEDDKLMSDEIDDLLRLEEVELPRLSEPDQAATDDRSISPPLLHPTEYGYSYGRVNEQVTTQLYEIYRRNGWPSATFDRQRCKDELLQWQEERRVARALADKGKSDERQRMLADPERRKQILASRKQVQAEIAAAEQSKS